MTFSFILRNLVVAEAYLKGKVVLPVRYFHCNVCQLNKYASRELRFMNKLMTKGRPKRSSWYKAEQTSGQPSLPTKSMFKHDHRRQVILNKLFMRNITDMMATGETASELVGRGIEISEVKVAADFKIVNVFWVAKGSESDTEVEEILNKSAKRLQHDLTQLRLMGIMPRIQFVKDNQYAKTMEVDRLLNIADFGEGYVPTTAGYCYKSAFSNPENKINYINNLKETDDIDEEELLHPVLPPMRMDVLGLNYADIMAKIKRSKNKAKLHNEAEHPCTEGYQEISDHKELQEEFSNFLKKRHITKMKKNCTKNYFPENELYQNELLDDSALYEELTEKEEKDYIYEY